MKTLLVMRHAKSSWSNPDLDDYDRPLSKRGRRAAKRMGKLLRDGDLVPEFILTSRAVRARRTVKLLVKKSGYTGSVKKTRKLYHGNPDNYIRCLRELRDDWSRVLLVGHNPGLEELLVVLTGQEEILATASLALVRLPVSSWRDVGGDGRGELLEVWTPKK